MNNMEIFEKDRQRDFVVQYLNKAGLPIVSISDLMTDFEFNDYIVSVILELLMDDRIDDLDTNEVLLRGLASRKVLNVNIDVIPQLVFFFTDKCKNNSTIQWVAGNTISIAMRKKDYPKVLPLIKNNSYAESRQMIVDKAYIFKDEKIEYVLLNLLNDKSVRLHALSSLNRIKSTKVIVWLKKNLVKDKSTFYKKGVKMINKNIIQ